MNVLYFLKNKTSKINFNEMEYFFTVRNSINVICNSVNLSSGRRNIQNKPTDVNAGKSIFKIHLSSKFVKSNFICNI